MCACVVVTYITSCSFACDNRFYQYVLEPELSFYDNGSLREDAVVLFSDLPTSPLLTLALDVPHSWLVEPVFSPHDLDNIHLADLPEGRIHAEFILEHILVEGRSLLPLSQHYAVCSLVRHLLAFVRLRPFIKLKLPALFQASST